jgi:hypothetical protein
VLVIGIANSIDLTDRALPALKLRGCSPSLLCFPAYTAAQMSAILAAAAARVDDRCAREGAARGCSWGCCLHGCVLQAGGGCGRPGSGCRGGWDAPLHGVPMLPAGRRGAKPRLAKHA